MSQRYKANTCQTVNLDQALNRSSTFHEGILNSNVLPQHRRLSTTHPQYDETQWTCFSPQQSVTLLCRTLSVTITKPLLQEARWCKKEILLEVSNKIGMFFSLWRPKSGDNVPSAQQEAVTGDRVWPFNTEALCRRLPATHHQMGWGQDWEGKPLTWSETLTAPEQYQS